jgi:hypothetical protein
MELSTGLLIVMDAGMAIWEFAMLTPRPKLLARCPATPVCPFVCQLFVGTTDENSDLGTTVTRRSCHVPVRILDALYDPFASDGD